jgi:hypothetical protein
MLRIQDGVRLKFGRNSARSNLSGPSAIPLLVPTADGSPLDHTTGLIQRTEVAVALSISEANSEAFMPRHEGILACVLSECPPERRAAEGLSARPAHRRGET